MKTPEEIKKGLECCENDSGSCSERCPYFDSLSNGVDCASKMHADSLAYIQELEAKVQKWISVKERRPDTEVIAISECGDIMRGYVTATVIDGAYVCENDYELLFDVTHWMPLPEPPTEV